MWISLCQVSTTYHLVENYTHNIMFYLILSVPAPVVSIYLNTDEDSVYQGTELIITCTATVHAAVNTRYNVNMMWSSEPTQIMNGQYITISETSSSGLQYTSVQLLSDQSTLQTQLDIPAQSLLIPLVLTLKISHPV